MASYQIKNIQGLFPKSKLISAKICKLTSAGDNYVGALLGVDVVFEERVVHLVAKVLPQNEFIQQLFNSQQTFRNEVGFYQSIIPCLTQFQREQGLPGFELVPEFYGARFNLDQSSTKVDEDGVLLIKNIKVEGFDTIDRRQGFNLEQTKLVLHKMVQLHGTAYALKRLKPEVFAKHIEPYLHEYKIFDAGSPTSASDMMDSICKMLENDDLSMKNMSRIKKALNDNVDIIRTKNGKDLTQSIFAGLVHSDMWVNNIMVKIVQEKIIDVKFVDFQLYEYSSLCRDVLFFLFTSVELPVLKQHYDELVAFYFDTFVKLLKTLKCDVSDLTLDGFLHEMDTIAGRTEFFHIMLMLRPIYAADQDAKEVEEMKQENFTDYETGRTAACEEKACYVVHEFMKRGWL